MRGAVRAGHVAEARVPFSYRTLGFPAPSISLARSTPPAEFGDVAAMVDQAGFRLSWKSFENQPEPIRELAGEVLKAQPDSNEPAVALSNLLLLSGSPTWTHCYFAPGAAAAIAPLSGVVRERFTLGELVRVVEEGKRELGLAVEQDVLSPEEVQTRLDLLITRLDEDRAADREVLDFLGLPGVRDAALFLDFYHQRWAAYVRASRFFLSPFTIIEGDPRSPLARQLKPARIPRGHSLVHEFLLYRAVDSRFKAAPAQVFVQDHLFHFTDRYGALYPVTHCSLTGKPLLCFSADPAEVVSDDDPEPEGGTV
jgi:hypothetical protein